MPRPRYPSDDRHQKQRPHVKIHLSCRSHPHYGHVFEDLESRAIIWGLWLLAVQYHAAQTDDEVTLGQGDLTWLTGRSQWAPAVNALRTLTERLGYPMVIEGRRARIKIRNLQQKQGFHSALRSGAPRSSAPSEEPRNQGTKEPIEETRAPRSPPTIPPGADERVQNLVAAILGSIPGQDVPAPETVRWAKWCVELDRLHRLDAWSWEQIDQLLAWLPSDDFWSGVIRSAKNLRKHFAMMHAKMEKPATPSKANSGYRETPDTSGPLSDYERVARPALERLRAKDRAEGERREHSREEVDREIERVEGNVPL